MIRAYSSWKSKIQYLKILEYFLRSIKKGFGKQKSSSYLKYVHLCTQYLAGSPLAQITASVRCGMEAISLWHCWGTTFFGTQRRRSHFSLPVLALIFPVLSCLLSRNTWETLSALLSKTGKNHGFDQLVSQRNWHHLLDEKLGFGGTWLPWRNVRSWLHDGRVG